MKTFYLILFTLLSSQSIAQLTSSTQEFELSANTLSIMQEACFSFGSPGSCPDLTDYSLTEIDDTLVIDLYYDIEGIWASFFCCTKDTISVGLSSNLCNVKIITSLLTEGSNGVEFDTLYQEDLSLLDTCDFVIDVEELSIVNTINVYPNPVSDHFIIENINGLEIEKVSIYNFLGQEVKTFREARGTYAIQSLPAGYYAIDIKTKKHSFLKTVYINK